MKGMCVHEMLANPTPATTVVAATVEGEGEGQEGSTVQSSSSSPSVASSLASALCLKTTSDKVIES